ncbi:MAG: primosomal protein N', partial [Rhodospirillales bacterium]|nr:primosomal protein N' [Rhodospirillales bacterium]
MAKRIVDVMLPIALDCAYSYRAPPELLLGAGDVVAVPLGAREAIGVVWADNPGIRPGLDNRLKEVDGKLDIPPLKPGLRAFIDWMADYTLAPRGMVLRMCLRMGRLGPERARIGIRLAGAPPQRMTAARARVLRLLSDGLARGKSDAAEEAGVSTSVIDALVDEGTLAALPMPA